MDLHAQQDKARQLRQQIISMLYKGQSGHPGGSLSIIEVLMALYYNTANVRPEDPTWDDRDRIILSKGHAAPALYAVLGDLGYFPAEDFETFRQVDGHLQGHPDMLLTPGVDVNTGSLGQGISVASGIALAAKQLQKEYQVYVVIGDGELQEGICWEAAMSAAHYNLDNFTLLLDYNGLQIDGSNDDVLSLGDITEKFKAFGFFVQTVDGHDIKAIINALQTPSEGKPRMICCKTVKGKGVSFMEDQFGWHGRVLTAEEYETAMKELEGVTGE